MSIQVKLFPNLGEILCISMALEPWHSPHGAECAATASHIQHTAIQAVIQGEQAIFGILCGISWHAEGDSAITDLDHYRVISYRSNRS